MLKSVLKQRVNIQFCILHGSAQLPLSRIRAKLTGIAER
jgi:hypothetical protein